jgi:hypothetical protein
LTSEPASSSTSAAFLDQLAEIRGDAARRGVDFITLRGLAERLRLPASRLPDLRRQLDSQANGNYDAPLWTVGRGARPRSCLACGGHQPTIAHAPKTRLTIPISAWPASIERM